MVHRTLALMETQCDGEMSNKQSPESVLCHDTKNLGCSGAETPSMVARPSRCSQHVRESDNGCPPELASLLEGKQGP